MPTAARRVSQLAGEAREVAARGGASVERVVASMRDINDGSARIEEIVPVIDVIAFQTNLLALNAAVEAARAGEQGLGFEVVASEVRGLAGRSASAAKKIKALIARSVMHVEEGTGQIDEAGATMRAILSSIHRVDDFMGEIKVANEEQRSGVLQVGREVGRMDQTTQQNVALAEQSAAAESLKDQAHRLMASVSAFRV